MQAAPFVDSRGVHYFRDHRGIVRRASDRPVEIKRKARKEKKKAAKEAQ